MKRVISFFAAALICIPTGRACRLTGPIVSLSSPVTGVLKELKLLGDPSLKAVSLFHPLALAEYAGARLGGGVFLSERGMRPYRDAVVYFDESAELAARLRRISFQGRVQVRTRGPDPFVIAENALVALSPRLEGCAPLMAQFRAWMEGERAFLDAAKPFPHPMYFFLGAIRSGKPPELMMVDDGFVGYWSRRGKIRTLDSASAYVRWGEKWRRGLKPTEVLMGLVEAPAGASMEVQPVGKNAFNVSDPGALSPGPGQIRFMRRFVERFAR